MSRKEHFTEPPSGKQGHKRTMSQERVWAAKYLGPDISGTVLVRREGGRGSAKQGKGGW